MDNDQKASNEAKEEKVTILDNYYKNIDLQIKVLVVGDVEVGKTSIFQQFTLKEFYESYSPTNCYEFFFIVAKVNDKVMKLQIWDNSGNASFRPICLNWFNNSELCILVYSVTSLDSFNNLPKWIEDLRNINESSPIVLLGNQIDDEENRQVTYEMGEKLKEKYNLEFFEEVSAKKGFDPEQNFIKKISKILYRNLIDDIESRCYVMNESIRLEDPKKSRRRDDCNC